MLDSFTNACVFILHIRNWEIWEKSFQLLSLYCFIFLQSWQLSLSLSGWVSIRVFFFIHLWWSREKKRKYLSVCPFSSNFTLRPASNKQNRNKLITVGIFPRKRAPLLFKCSSFFLFLNPNWDSRSSKKDCWMNKAASTPRNKLKGTGYFSFLFERHEVFGKRQNTFG